MLKSDEWRKLEGSRHCVHEGNCCSVYLPRQRKITKLQAGSSASHLNLKVRGAFHIKGAANNLIASSLHRKVLISPVCVFKVDSILNTGFFCNPECCAVLAVMFAAFCCVEL